MSTPIKKRVLMIAACPFPGNRGTPSRILKMTEALCREGVSVDVLTYHSSDFTIQHPLFNIFRTKNLFFAKDNSPGPKLWKPFADFLLLFKGVYLCKKHRYDVIHGQHIEGAFVGVLLARIFNIPLVYDAHFVLQKELPSYNKYNNSFVRLVLKSLENFCYHNASFVIFVDEEIEKFARKEKLLTCESVVIPTGTNIDELLEISKDVKSPFDENELRKKIVYTGSIAKYQDVDDVVKVAESFIGAGVVFYIATGATKEQSAELLALVKHKNVEDLFIFAYNQSFKNQLAYIKFADIVLSPRNDCTGLPQKIPNYMVFGKKIVASDGSAKIIDNNNAWVYSRSDIHEFESSLSDALNYTGSKNTILPLLVQKYDWDNLVNLVLVAYNSSK